jgi:hypothetical protein|tara:strand:- start:2028 stop:2654 length:627 start_codon:yes stop_codon:yes gene_type:complete
MSEFAKYLTESAKQYEYRIKIAGDIDKDFGTKLEQSLAKFEVAKMSAGKTTPIQEMPLDFPKLKNTQVTIFELTTNYPASVFEMHEYIAYQMNLTRDCVVVRKPNEPSEEYQEQMKDDEEKSEFVAKLQDIEYKDAPQVKAEEVFGDKANQSLLKELLKDKQAKFEIEKEETPQKSMSKEEEGTPSPVKDSGGPVKGNPDPLVTAGKK